MVYSASLRVQAAVQRAQLPQPALQRALDRPKLLRSMPQARPKLLCSACPQLNHTQGRPQPQGDTIIAGRHSTVPRRTHTPAACSNTPLRQPRFMRPQRTASNASRHTVTQNTHNRCMQQYAPASARFMRPQTDCQQRFQPQCCTGHTRNRCVQQHGPASARFMRP